MIAFNLPAGTAGSYKKIVSYFHIVLPDLIISKKGDYFFPLRFNKI